VNRFEREGVGSPTAMTRVVARPPDRRIGRTPIWLCLAWTIFWLSVPYLGPRRQDATTSTAIVAPGNLAPRALVSYFTDEAHLFTGVDVERFNSVLAKFEKETSSQIAVAVYAETPDVQIETFTLRTAELSRLGRKGLDNGVILFVFPTARIARLEIGYGLEPVLSDGKVGAILDQSLIPAWSRGESTEAVEATLAALFDNVREAYRAGRMPGILTVFRRQLAVELPRFIRDAWPEVRGIDLQTRIVIAFIGSLIVMGLFDGLVQAMRLLRAFGCGTVNLVMRRPLKTGIKPLQIESLVDSVKVILIFAFALASLIGIVVVAGGGAFGGAGAIRHW
jgi:uncharacterized membrane protein YgcG